MATYGKTEITGGKELARVLRALPKQLAVRDQNFATRKGALVIAEAIKARAPISDDVGRRRRVRSKKTGESFQGKDYGKLVDNIKATKVKSDSRFQSKYFIHIGRAFWGLFQEFGTTRHGANPFMRSGFEASREKAIGTVAVELRKRLPRTAKKLAGSFSKSGLAKSKFSKSRGKRGRR